ncbi:MAG: DUF5711 family protein [Lachnospiraceae bacterium]
MSDMSSMSRERKKQQLRRQVVVNNNAVPFPKHPGQSKISRRNSDFQSQTRQNSTEAAEELKKFHIKKLQKRMIAAAVFLVLLAGIFGGIYYWKTYYRFQEYSVNWEADLTAGEEGIERSSANYVNFGKNVLKYTKDGASYIDNKGKTIWVQTFEMKAPIAAVNGSFAAIADQQGNSIYIFNEEGAQGVATTLLPIVRISISGKGIVAAAQEDSKSSYVSMFKRDGSDLKLTMKSTLSKNGYLMDLSFSPDGTQLICSYAYIDGSALRSRVVIYDYSDEVGANLPDRIVSANEEAFADKVVPRVRYLSETESFACADTGLAFFSSENRANPVLTVQTEEERIESLFYSDKYVGLVTANSAGPEPEKLVVYRGNGTKVFETGLDYSYTSGNIDGEYVILYNDNSCKIYNMKGVEKFGGEIDFQISYITSGGLSNQFILTGPQKMQAITFR